MLKIFEVFKVFSNHSLQQAKNIHKENMASGFFDVSRNVQHVKASACQGLNDDDKNSKDVLPCL